MKKELMDAIERWKRADREERRVVMNDLEAHASLLGSGMICGATGSSNNAFIKRIKSAYPERAEAMRAAANLLEVVGDERDGL